MKKIFFKFFETFKAVKSAKKVIFKKTVATEDFK